MFPVSELPWLARFDEKLWRLIGPEKPLPIVTPVTSPVAAKLLAEKGKGRALISICAAGGQGVVAILER